MTAEDLDAPEAILLGPYQQVPNHPLLPALILRGAVSVGSSTDDILARYRANDWGGAWVWSVFDYHHYHPNAHEVLTCAAGWAELCLGGEGGAVRRIAAGDAVLLPAGFGHCKLADGDGFTVCGAYPPEQAEPVITTDARIPMTPPFDRIAGVPLPATDPLFGADGPLIRAWRATGDADHGA